MKVIDKTPLQDAKGNLGIVQRVQSAMEYGFAWQGDIEAQKPIIAQLERVLEKGHTLIRNLSLENSKIIEPMILIGPPGVFVLYVTRQPGFFEAKGDEWNSIQGDRRAPVAVNPMTRVARLSRALQVYLNRQGVILPCQVDAVLIAGNPAVHIDALRPIVRIVQSDAVKQWAASLLQARPVLRSEVVFDVVDRLLNPRSTPTPLQPQTAQMEFASDGTDLYLLQCRAQSYTQDSAPAVIPRGVAEEDVVFRAHRYVSNGQVPDITHIVYVDPQAYSELETSADLMAVARAVGKLNANLPKRRFILMGPGRWGSRGDSKLGVSVAYSEISNSAVLVEIARQKGGYVPDLSFGTHFFQGLVESSIRYLPLFPDEAGSALNEGFLLGAPNLLAAICPEYSYLARALRVIDVREAAAGRVLRIFMNAEEEEALGLLVRA